MNHDRVLFVYGLFAAIVLLVSVAAAILLREARTRNLETRMLAAIGNTATGGSSATLAAYGGIMKNLVRIGEAIRGRTRLYSPEDLANLEAVIAGSGLDPRRALPVLLSAKLILMILIPGAAILYAFLADFVWQGQVLLIGASIIIGMLGPDWIIGFLRRPYLAALRRGISDALDLLVVCSEAGMGLESALEEVSREIYYSNRPMAVALTGLLDELKVLPDRRQAFENFGRRSGVEGIQRLATMLSQSLQYGTPLSQALRAVSGELRRDRMIQLEEKAAKLPPKLIMPLILFIMPCLFIVLVGSSILQLFDMLDMLTGTKG